MVVQYVNMVNVADLWTFKCLTACGMSYTSMGKNKPRIQHLEGYSEQIRVVCKPQALKHCPFLIPPLSLPV